MSKNENDGAGTITSSLTANTPTRVPGDSPTGTDGQTATEIPSLTSVRNVPSSCLATLASCIPTGRGPAQTLCVGGEFMSNCYPSRFKSATYYSPGICPQSYTVAAAYTTTNPPATTGICCPTGFSYNDPEGPQYNPSLESHQCVSTVSATTTAPLISDPQIATLLPSDLIIASLIRVKWQPSDQVIVDAFGAASLTAIANLAAKNSGTGVAGVGNDKTTTSVSGGSIGTQGSTAAAAHGSSKSNLVVKIVVPIVVVLLAILAVVVFLIFRKRKQKHQAYAEDSTRPVYGEDSSHQVYGQDSTGLPESPALEYPTPPVMAARAAAVSAVPNAYPSKPPPPLMTNVSRAPAGEEGDGGVSPISSGRPSFENVPVQRHIPRHTGVVAEPISPVESTHSNSFKK